MEILNNVKKTLSFKRTNSFGIPKQFHEKSLSLGVLSSSLENKRASFSKNQWKLKELEFLKTLGEGSYGKVKLALHSPSGEYFAVKILNKKKVALILSKLKEEIKALQLLKNPFVVTLYKVLEDDQKIYLVQEFVAGGDFLNILKTCKTLTEEQARFYFVEIFLAVQYTHKFNILIRDLKPENILIDSTGHIKLCDFGLCKKLGKNEKRYSFCGTLDYMPPEVLKKEHQDISVDYWSLGCVLYEMIYGSTPFFDKDDKTCSNKILKYDWKFEGKISSQLQDLILLLLEIDPKKRLENIKKIKKHPWLKDINWKEAEKQKLEPPFVPDVQKLTREKKNSLDNEIQLTKEEIKLFKLLSMECSIEKDQ